MATPENPETPKTPDETTAPETEQILTLGGYDLDASSRKDGPLSELYAVLSRNKQSGDLPVTLEGLAEMPVVKALEILKTEWSDPNSVNAFAELARSKGLKGGEDQGRYFIEHIQDLKDITPVQQSDIEPEED